MPDVTSMRDLLVDCLQDLKAGEVATLQRAPALQVAVASPSVAAALERRLVHARERARGLDTCAEELGVSAEGPENLWMSGMLEDAKRDTETVEPGSCLDIALIGAFRKMVQAARVSYETAVCVAEGLGMEAVAARCRRARDQEADSDGELATALRRLTAAGEP